MWLQPPAQLLSWSRGTQRTLWGGEGLGPGEAGHRCLRLGKSCQRVIHVWTSRWRGNSSAGLSRLTPSQEVGEGNLQDTFRVEERWFGNDSALTQTAKFKNYLFSSMGNKRIGNLELKHLDFISTSISAYVCPSESLLTICKVEWYCLLDLFLIVES